MLKIVIHVCLTTFLVVVILCKKDTPGYGSVVDAQVNLDQFMNYVGQTFEEKNKRVNPFSEVTNNELMRSLVTGTNDKQRSN